jgi:hypothetical protein
MTKPNKCDAIFDLLCDVNNKRPTQTSLNRVIRALRTLELDRDETVLLLFRMGYTNKLGVLHDAKFKLSI